MNINTKIIYNMTIDSRDFGLIMSALKQTGGGSSRELAERLQKMKKENFEKIANQLGFTLTVLAKEDEQ